MPVAKVARTHNLVDSAAEGAEHAIRSTQEAANKALDQLADSVDSLRGRGSPALERAREYASDYAHRGLDNMRDMSLRMRERAQHASDQTLGYIRDEPVKALLIAAATGAVLMALVNLFRHTSSSQQHRSR